MTAFKMICASRTPIYSPFKSIACSCTTFTGSRSLITGKREGSAVRSARRSTRGSPPSWSLIFSVTTVVTDDATWHNRQDSSVPELEPQKYIMACTDDFFVLSMVKIVQKGYLILRCYQFCVRVTQISQIWYSGSQQRWYDSTLLDSHKMILVFELWSLYQRW